MKKHVEALATLSQAHLIGLEKLELLQELPEDMANGRVPAVQERLATLFAFIDGELRAHFRQEEEILFPALEEPLAGPGPITLDGEEPDFCFFLFCESACRLIGPLAIYRRDHQMIWNAIDRLRSAWLEIGRDNSDPEFRLRLEHAAAEVEWLLGSHIAKEDEVLLPKVAEILDDQELAELGLALGVGASR